MYIWCFLSLNAGSLHASADLHLQILVEIKKKPTKNTLRIKEFWSISGRIYSKGSKI